VLVVDTLGEGSGLVRRLLHADVDADDVPMAGLGAAVADADLVLLEATAIGPSGFIGVAGSRAAAATAKHAGVPVWLVGGVGRLMPKRMWDALAGRLDAMGEPWELDDELVPMDLVDRIVMSAGVLEVGDALTRIDCPIAPELFKSVDPL
jgi:translation initiation factor 2B subunit (eIF-2B alpha/beta/delta family)